VATGHDTGYHFAVLHFLHKLSAILFTLLGLALFAMEVLWRQGLWMPWSQVLLTTIPTPLIAIGLLYGCLSIVLSAKEGNGRPMVGVIVGIACIALFAVFATLRLWPLS
jgi:ABC-type thiamin/hydroxymethylpyrimidine transport system permease subunit